MGNSECHGTLGKSLISLSYCVFAFRPSSQLRDHSEEYSSLICWGAFTGLYQSVSRALF